MDKYEQLKQEYTTLSGHVEAHAPAFDREDLLRYVLGGMMKIWGSFALYAPDYSYAVEAITGRRYTLEQLLTALSCCGDSERTLLVPAFFQDMAERDKADGTTHSRTFIELLNDFLVSTASINGDFTMEEANALSDIVKDLETCCAVRGLPTKPVDLADKITEAKEESYLHSLPADPKPPAAEPTPPPKEDAPEPLSITVTFDFTGTGGAVSSSLEPASQEGETAPAASAPQEERSEDTLESLLAELDGLVGLETVKRDVHSLLNFIKVAKIREGRGMKVPVISYHLVFTGNPGTGKTTVARLVAKLYYHMGILPKGQLVETDRSALVAGYLGQTAIKTQKVIQQALGGVLFIDEAYSLAGETDDSYGREAVETILKAMEDHRDELVVIVAGYDELMHKFIDSNPGLASRFSKYFFFPDYNGEELLKIFQRFCKTNGYTVEPAATAQLTERFDRMFQTREEHFGNARAIRNIFEKAINCQADRIAGLTALSDADLETITCADLDAAMKGA